MVDQLHCTLINTSYRRPRARMPFAYDEILRSDALKEIAVTSLAELPSSHTQLPASSRASTSLLRNTDLPTDTIAPPARAPPPSGRDKLVKVNLGTWMAKEIQLCIMGSHGPENEYISVGRIRLDTP